MSRKYDSYVDIMDETIYTRQGSAMLILGRWQNNNWLLQVEDRPSVGIYVSEAQAQKILRVWGVSV